MEKEIAALHEQVGSSCRDLPDLSSVGNQNLLRQREEKNELCAMLRSMLRDALEEKEALAAQLSNSHATPTSPLPSSPVVERGELSELERALHVASDIEEALDGVGGEHVKRLSFSPHQRVVSVMEEYGNDGNSYYDDIGEDADLAAEFDVLVTQNLAKAHEEQRKNRMVEAKAGGLSIEAYLQLAEGHEGGTSLPEATLALWERSTQPSFVYVDPTTNTIDHARMRAILDEQFLGNPGREQGGMFARIGRFDRRSSCVTQWPHTYTY